MANARTWILRAAAAAAVLAAGGCARAEPHALTFSGSLVGREGDVIRRQLDRFRESNPRLTSRCGPRRTRRTSGISCTCSG